MQFINHPLFEALGWTLIHSLWQATLLAFLVYVGQQMLSTAPARRRFELGGLALLAQLVVSLGTFMVIWQGSASVPTSDNTFVNIVLSESAGSGATTFYWIPTLALLWTLGALASAARLMNSYLYTKRLGASGQPISDSWSARCQSLANRLHIQKPVQLMVSSLTQVPLTINHIKPLILFPIGLINQLSNEEIEAVLAHELAHIRRNDFILNIFFSFIEALFYFHPAIWWISARMNDAREESCDELAVQLVGNRVQYARTLVRVQENVLANEQMGNWQTSMAFSGRKGHMQQRILRILQVQNPQHKKRDRLFAYLLVALIGSGLWMSSLSANTIENGASAEPISSTLPTLEAPWCVSWADNGAIEKLTIRETDIPENHFQFYIDEINKWDKANFLSCHENQNITADESENKSNHRSNNYNLAQIRSKGLNNQVFTFNNADHELIFINTSPSQFIFPRAKTRFLVSNDTLPSRGNYNYQKNDNGNRTEIKIKDGVIEKLIIDGERIAPEDYPDFEPEVESIMRQSAPPSAPEFPDMSDFPDRPDFPEMPEFPELAEFDNFEGFNNFEDFSQFKLDPKYGEALQKASEELERQAEKMEKIAQKLAAEDLGNYSELLEEYHQELKAAQEEIQLRQEDLQNAEEENQGFLQLDLEERQAEAEKRQMEMLAHQEQMHAEMQEHHAEMQEHQLALQEEMTARQQEIHEELQARHEEMEHELQHLEIEHAAQMDWHNTLREEVISDGLIRDGQRLNMIYHKGKLKINGQQIEGELLKKYKKLLRDNDGPRLNDNNKFEIHMN